MLCLGAPMLRKLWMCGGLGVRIAALAASVPAFLAAPAQAAPLDVRFDRFYETTADGTKIQNDAIKLLMREVALAMGPRSAGPISSQGALGVDAAYEIGFSGAKSTADYWKKGVDQPSDTLTSHVIRVRKGLPQSVQIGTSLTHLADSNLYAAGMEMQLSLVDGFQNIPDIGVRGGINAVLGNSRMDFVTGAVDLAISKSFGVGGVAMIQPWLAWSPSITYYKPNLEPLIPDDKSLKTVLPKFAAAWPTAQRAAIGLRVVAFRVQLGVEFTRSFTDELNLITTRIGAVF
jgi:hypothetical protein